MNYNEKIIFKISIAFDFTLKFIQNIERRKVIMICYAFLEIARDSNLN
jgi:hypothetical protein